MGLSTKIGKYQLSESIGQGTFAKVKLALDTSTGQYVAVKIIDKKMVMQYKLMDQVKREISTMRLLNHPNIVRIYEVIATKTKIYIVMEYISGGQLSNKLSYLKRMTEQEARKYFQQLIDAVEYCHSRGVYHRDLKPENLLIDGKGNLKVSDFGLSALRKPGDLLSTICGSPCYASPEVITNKNYDGAAADVWSCGVILFELLAGYLPFDDINLMNLSRMISRAEYKCPEWFTGSQKKLISRILEPLERRRITIAEIVEDEWFQINYEPFIGINCNVDITLEATNTAINEMERKSTEVGVSKSSSFINAFLLIAMSNDLDLSGLFEEQQDDNKKKTRLGSRHPIHETIEKIKDAAKDASLSVERMNNSKVLIYQKHKMTRFSRICFNLSAEVIQVTPMHCVVEISKFVGDPRMYKEFCKSLSGLLIDKPSGSDELQVPKIVSSDGKDVQENGRLEDEGNSISKTLCGYSSL
ncbi:PREDICTED: CBL-interacting serine/threonine-protein kinase 21 [Nelumbo nucifera]|uniref:non-specific serine/threonine protein kinase n=1 Tax=Nelumbo nucifera TaxID=4432 RepID=A0A1U8ADE0_NELNU|nr:PREDICTED: CBL-interacting serine/threonine-protein kinase 21 [Nelumbo nucifera]